jgi:hypothetical protein
MFDLKLSPVLVGKTIEDIQRNRAVAERIGMPDSMVRLAAAEHDRKLLFTAIRKEMRAQYLIRRNMFNLTTSGKLTRIGQDQAFHWVLGFCAAMVALGYPDDLIPTMTAFLASARDADDAMGLDRFGNPKQEEAS